MPTSRTGTPLMHFAEPQSPSSGLQGLYEVSVLVFWTSSTGICACGVNFWQSHPNVWSHFFIDACLGSIILHSDKVFALLFQLTKSY